MRTVIVDGVEEHDPECTNCNHDCPWRRHHFGAPYCQICDDHAEARDVEWAEASSHPSYWSNTEAE